MATKKKRAKPAVETVTRASVTVRLSKYRTRDGFQPMEIGVLNNYDYDKPTLTVMAPCGEHLEVSRTDLSNIVKGITEYLEATK